MKCRLPFSMKTLTTVVLVALLVACVTIHTGVCFVQESIPESGSTVVGDEGERITIFCRVLNETDGTQVVTEWFIQRRDGSSPQTIVSDPDSNYNITGGGPLPNPVIAGQTYQTNLTILRLTSDLDRATLSCGRGGTPPTIDASFILRIYRPPNLVDNLAVEGSTNTVSLRQAPDAFPFPQQFSWTVNGSPARNNSRVTFGYPSVTFQRFERGDAGTYTLTATNYRLDDNSVIVGMDTGTFILNVQYVCFVEDSTPESGSTVVGGEGESVTFYCRVLNEANGTQVATEWFIQEIGAVSPQTVVRTQSNFNITGEPLPNPVIPGQTYQTNLTILSLTSDLDRAVVGCGCGGTPPAIDASFVLRIYRPPNVIDSMPVVAVEGRTGTVSLHKAPDPFPFPQQFRWTVNGSPANNNSRLTFGYPSVTFQPFIRGDAGIYMLTATNYHLDDNSVVVGTDTGSFTLDVHYSPQFVGPGGDTQHVVLEGGSITLMCGSSIDGKPTPTISWLDNYGRIVSGGVGVSGSTTLSLTITGVTRYQAGNWTCTAVNSPGGTLRSVQHQIMMTVVVPPSQPMNISIQSMDIGPTFVRVHWQAPVFRGIPKASHYEITVTQTDGRADLLTFYDNDEAIVFNVTGLAPATRYEFRVVAVSEIVGRSPASDPVFANTTTTIPAPVCLTLPTSSGGVITVRWNYTHTGGLELTQVMVAAYMGTLANIQLDVPNGNLTDLSQMSLNIATFTAGFRYTFSVTAYNLLGSSTAQCDPVIHLIGVPQVPDTPTGVSHSSGSVVLTLHTPTSGRTLSHIFSFIVNFTQTSNGMKGSRTLEASDYVDGEDRQFIIDGLMEGEQYVFNAQARNQFGFSKFSGNSDLITIYTAQNPQPRVTINVAVGIAVVVTGTIAFVVGVLAGALVYHYISKHRSQLKPESSSHQQQQTDPEYEAVPATSGKEKFELRENIAYEPVQH